MALRLQAGVQKSWTSVVREGASCASLYSIPNLNQLRFDACLSRLFSDLAVELLGNSRSNSFFEKCGNTMAAQSHLTMVTYAHGLKELAAKQSLNT